MAETPLRTYVKHAKGSNCDLGLCVLWEFACRPRDDSRRENATVDSAPHFEFTERTDALLSLREYAIKAKAARTGKA